MIKYVLLIAILIAHVAFAQQRVAVLNTEDDGVPPLRPNELSVLTDKLRGIATKILLTPKYDIMTAQTIQSFLGSQNEVEKVCNSANGCLAKIGQDIEADFIGQARLNRFGNLITIKMEFYNVKKGTLVKSFTDESSKNINNLLTVIEKKAPEVFKEITIEHAPVTNKNDDTFTDPRDGKKYKTVKIGYQVWMAENLNYNAKGSVCYDNKQTNCDKYGRLYNDSIVSTYILLKKHCKDTEFKNCKQETDSTVNEVCPKGWHMANEKDWDELLHFADRSNNKDKTYTIGTAGKFLKSNNGWNKNGNGTNEYGFTALPSGYGKNGSFYGIGDRASWWSNSSIKETIMWNDSDGMAMEGAFSSSMIKNMYDNEYAASGKISWMKDINDNYLGMRVFYNRDGKGEKEEFKARPSFLHSVRCVKD